MGFRKTKRYIIVAALSFLLVMATAATVCVGGGGGAEKVVSLGGIGFLRNIKLVVSLLDDKSKDKHWRRR